MLKTFVLGLFVSLSFLIANTPDKAQSLPEGTKKVKVVLNTEDGVTRLKDYIQLVKLAHADSYLIANEDKLLDFYADISYVDVSKGFVAEMLVPMECIPQSDWVVISGGLTFGDWVLDSDNIINDYLEPYGECIIEKDTSTTEYINGLKHFYSEYERLISSVTSGSDIFYYLDFRDDKTYDIYKSAVGYPDEPIAKVTYPIKASFGSESVTLPVYEVVVVTRAEVLKRLYEVAKYSYEYSSKE